MTTYHLEVEVDEYCESPRDMLDTLTYLALTDSDYSHLDEASKELHYSWSAEGDRVTPKVDPEDEDYDENYPYGELQYGTDSVYYDLRGESDLIRFACRSDIIALPLYGRYGQIYCEPHDVDSWEPDTWGDFEYEYNQIGFAIITEKRAHEAGLSWDNKQRLITIAEREIEEFSAWAAGECYYYRIVDDDNVDIETVGGFWSYDDAVREGQASLKHFNNEVPPSFENHVAYCEAI